MLSKFDTLLLVVRKQAISWQTLLQPFKMIRQCIPTMNKSQRLSYVWKEYIVANASFDNGRQLITYPAPDTLSQMVFCMIPWGGFHYHHMLIIERYAMKTTMALVNTLLIQGQKMVRVSVRQVK